MCKACPATHMHTQTLRTQTLHTGCWLHITLSFETINNKKRHHKKKLLILFLKSNPHFMQSLQHAHTRINTHTHTHVHKYTRAHTHTHTRRQDDKNTMLYSFLGESEQPQKQPLLSLLLRTYPWKRKCPHFLLDPAPHRVSVPQLDNLAVHGKDKVKGFMKGQVFDGKVILMVFDPHRKTVPNVVEQHVPRAGSHTQSQSITVL